MADAKKIERTKPNSHRATQRGYAIPEGGAGELVEEGQTVPANVAVSDEWMEAVGGKRTTAAEREMARATEEALNPQPDDIDLEQVSGDALTAHALQFGINRGKLADDKLRAAVRAARDKDRTQ